MPAEFAVDDAGRVTTYIADAQAELHQYELQLLTPDSCDWPDLLAAIREYPSLAALTPTWACRLVRIDTEAVHLLARLGPARWICTCGDRKYRRKLKSGCKHLVFAAAFRALCAVTRPPTGVPA